MKYNIRLVQCSRTNVEYKDIRDRHYVENHGCIGRQCHYLVYIDECEKPVGVISGASAVWACKPRDDFFNINKDNRKSKINKIICNVVFRLEYNKPNLGSQILSKWRKQILIDWEEKYHDNVLGFETFIFGENRFGCLYKADNWVYCGDTKGSAKFKPHGAYGVGLRVKTDIKMCFCKGIKGVTR